jgi:hypothetical protein
VELALKRVHFLLDHGLDRRVLLAVQLSQRSKRDLGFY